MGYTVEITELTSNIAISTPTNNINVSTTTPTIEVYYDTVATAGPQGPQGIQGNVGPQGPQGNIGATGPQGNVGANGVSVSSATVNGSGNLVITLSNATTLNAGFVKGDTGAQGPQGIQGIQGNVGATGNTGATGPQGTNINLKGTVANVASLPSSGNSVADAYIIATNAAEPEAGNLYAWSSSNTWVDVGQIVGPKGDTGAQGIQGNVGATGAQGPQGNVGNTGATGTSITNAQVVGSNLQITFSNSSAIWAGNVIGPQGATGATGATGSTGATGNVGRPGGIPFVYTNSTVIQNPGDGIINFNTQNLSNISRIMLGGSVAREYIGTWDDSTSANLGFMTIFGTITGTFSPGGVINKELYEVYRVTAVSQPTGYSIANVTVVSSNGFFNLTTGSGYTGTLYVDFSRTGDKGETGATGATGATGPQGIQGNVGPQGIQGIQGNVGPQGIQGNVGATGATGPQGIQGNVGPQGNAGTFSGNLTSNLDPSGYSITSNIASTLANNDASKSVVRFENTDTRENVGSAISIKGKGNTMTLGVLGNDPTILGFGLAQGSNFIQGPFDGSLCDLYFFSYGNIYTGLGTSINASGISLDAGKQVTIGGVALTSYSNVEVAAYLVANPQPGTYSNTQVASYLVANPQPGTYSNTQVQSYLTSQSITAYGNTQVASYLTENPPASSYGNTQVASYLVVNPQPGTYSNTNVAAYLVANPPASSYGNTQVASYLAGNVTVGNVAGKTSGFTIGYLEMPQVTAGNVTLALADSGKHYYDTSTAPITITIPNNANVAFPTGTVITLVNASTGNLIVGRENAVSLYLGGNATSAGRTITTYGVATLLKVNTNDWFINGSGVV